MRRAAAWKVDMPPVLGASPLSQELRESLSRAIAERMESVPRSWAEPIDGSEVQARPDPHKKVSRGSVRPAFRNSRM